MALPVNVGQVGQLILRSRMILISSMIAQLSRGLACCRIAKSTSDDSRRLQYLLVAEATSAKFYKLRSQGKIVESKAIQRYMARLEEELGGRLYSSAAVRDLVWNRIRS